MNTARLWLPLLLGGAAALGNFLVLRSATSTHEILAFRRELKPGEVITADCLRRVSVRGEESLWKGTIPSEQMSAILNKPVRRAIAPGELVFQADIEYPATDIASHLLPQGYQSLTLVARRSSLASKPLAANTVKVTIKSDNERGTSSFGPFLFLGSYQESGKGGNDTDPVVRFAIAVPNEPGIGDRRLRELQYSPYNDRVISVEVVNAETAPQFPSR